MMLSILFWNLMGNSEASWNRRADQLRTIVRRMHSGLDFDVLLLAESKFHSAELCEVLNEGGERFFAPRYDVEPRVQFVTRLPEDSISIQYSSEDGRLTAWTLRIEDGIILLATLHSQSGLFWTPESQLIEMTSRRDELATIESDVGTDRTILIGDFNLDPFNASLTGALGAVMTRDLARLSS